MWEIPIAKICVFLITSWQIIKSYTDNSIKLSRSNQYRSYFIEKDIIKGIMEGSSKEVIGNKLIYIYLFFDEIYVEQFSISDQFDDQFSAILKVFF